MAIRSIAVSVFLVAVAFVGNPADTYRALVTQPTPPAVNHATPWVSLAPRVTDGTSTLHHAVTVARGIGHPALIPVPPTPPLSFVAGGPGRMIDLGLVMLLALSVWRRPRPAIEVVWLCAVVLASRCLFEAVMTPYYLAPPLLLCLVLVARQGARQFGASVILAIEITVFSYHHLAPWVWWLPIVTGLGFIVGIARPTTEVTLVSEKGKRMQQGRESSIVSESAPKEGLDLPTDPGVRGADRVALA